MKVVVYSGYGTPEGNAQSKMHFFHPIDMNPESATE
jgi:hypothetical protein